MYSKYLLAAALAVACTPAFVEASCPNNCKGQGTCGEHDQCTCYNGYAGADCSERLCPYAKAWVQRPRGDINFDGTVISAATYATSQEFSAREYVLDEENPGGTWEFAPSYLKAGEAHVYMECANKGICNKEKGQCECAPGFTGKACQRALCDNDCNGNGQCMTIAEELAHQNKKAGTSVTYTLWDADMQTRCVCDPGYEGASCEYRSCPKGDDPLTKVNQVHSTQIVEIWSNTVGDIATDGSLGGTFTLEFEDQFRHVLKTQPISIVQMGAAGSAQVAVDTKNALEALANDVIPTVEVTAQYCEKTVKGAYDANFVGGTNADNMGASYFLRCPSAAISGSSCSDVVAGTTNEKDGASIWQVGTNGCGLAISAVPTATFDASVGGCTAIQYPRCIRLSIRFIDDNNSGEQKLLKVNHDAVTSNSKTNIMNGGTQHVFSNVQRSRDLTFNTASNSLVTKGDFIHDVGATYNPNLKTVAIVDLASGGGTIFPDGLKVKVECSTDGATWYAHGNHVVDGTKTISANGETITLVDEIGDPHGRCFGASNQIRITTTQDFIKTDTDLSNENLVAGGYNLKMGSIEVKSIVSSVVAYPSGAASTVGYILLADSHGADIADSGNAITMSGTGTKEQDLCGSRGKCDYETGVCKCGKGYSGYSCQLQNALHMESS